MIRRTANRCKHNIRQYRGAAWAPDECLHTKGWDTTRIDLVSDITAIPAPDSGFDAILCSEVLKHVPEPTHALDEFARLLKPGGKLVLTTPLGSNVHMAPYHYCSGFSKYWYEYHLAQRGFHIEQLTANWRLVRSVAAGNHAPWAAWNASAAIGLGLLPTPMRCWGWLRSDKRAEDLACFGWHCVAVKQNG